MTFLTVVKFGEVSFKNQTVLFSVGALEQVCREAGVSVSLRPVIAILKRRARQNNNFRELVPSIESKCPRCHVLHINHSVYGAYCSDNCYFKVKVNTK